MKHTDERLSALYERYGDRVLSYLNRRLGENASDDAAAEVWARIARAHAADRAPRIDQVVQEVIYDFARAMAAAPIPVGLEQDVREAAAQGGLGFLTQELAQFPADFDASVRGLDPEDFDAFVLTDLRGLPEREAAGVLGTSQMTINRRRESARTFLREEIAA